METLIARIRQAKGIGADLHDVHDTIMSSKDPPTEGEFYLAWKAAEILDNDPSPNGSNPKVERTVQDDGT